MQCVKLLKKRSLDLEPWDFCSSKRVCMGAELVEECPMETCDGSNLPNQLPQTEQLKPGFRPSLSPGPGLVCQRCLKGEPGHINHIRAFSQHQLWVKSWLFDKSHEESLCLLWPQFYTVLQSLKDKSQYFFIYYFEHEASALDLFVFKADVGALITCDYITNTAL